MIYLSLHSNNLIGEIPPGIDNMMNLEELWLGYLNLSGQIPSELGNLTHLKKISDLERLAIRVKNETAIPRDLLALKQSLQEIPNIKFIYRNDSGFENINA